MQNKPSARYENIVVQELSNEILVCALNDNRVFCLNETAGEVWKLCNGERDVSEIAQTLSRKLRTNFSEEMVLLSLEKLSQENLLAEKYLTKTYFNGVSRREMVRRAGLASMIALPIMSSVAMPTATNAASATLNLGQPCSISGQCSGGFCVDGVCCDQACASVCFRCNLPERVGGCIPVPAGQDPDTECPGATTCNGRGACYNGALGTRCGEGYQCSSGFCADGVCCDKSCSARCESCTSGVLSPGSCFDLSLIGACP